MAAVFADLLGEAAAPDLVADVFVTAGADASGTDAGRSGGGRLSAAVVPGGAARLRAAADGAEAGVPAGLLMLRVLAALADCERARTGLKDARLLPVVQNNTQYTINSNLNFPMTFIC